MQNSHSFPSNFIWGAATSAYQIEGAYNADGKGESIWDKFCNIPGNIKHNDHGKIACNHYYCYKEDVAIMKNLGIKHYRFSISWSRILPYGSGEENIAGITFYNNLISELLAAGIQPWVTLYHWDLPNVLEESINGWQGGAKIVQAFVNYSDTCFKHFGDRVKNWITINESWVVAILGYGHGVFAPGKISKDYPYQVGHNLLLAHAYAVQLYRTKYQPLQKGQIGITNNCDWREPLTKSPFDVAAAERALQFFLGWFADPVYFGDYPQIMKDRLGNRLPQFTNAEKELLKGSTDFFGLNHYTTMYAADSSGVNGAGTVYGNGGLSEDQDVILSVNNDWGLTDMHWAIVPWGLKKLLHWINNRYNNPPIFITENGCAFNDDLENNTMNDKRRIEFFEGYLKAMHEAITEGVNVQGYFIWSLLDNFEWALGYDKQFGIIHVDLKTQVRTLKASAYWYKNVIQQNKVHSFALQ